MCINIHYTRVSMYIVQQMPKICRRSEIDDIPLQVTKNHQLN